MKIRFQEEDFNAEKELSLFSKKNFKSGSIMVFLGKVKPSSDGKTIESIDIEYYKKMAFTQTKKIITKLKKKCFFDDYLLLHRFGNLFPGENIVLLLVASKHRKDSYFFIETVVDWLKIKITFWKKENFKNKSHWVEQTQEDMKKIKNS